jgi:uncharacterized damage-inducible protein DinB
MTPQEAVVIAQFNVAVIEQEMPTTLRVFRAVPADRLDYRPDPVSKSALGLLRHIPVEDEWLINSIADGAFAPPPTDGDDCGIHTPEEAVARYTERIPAALARIRAMSPEQLAGEIDFFGMMKLPAAALLSLVSHHSVHHRGQLSSYLRAMGGKVPSIYGPSADTQGM